MASDYLKQKWRLLHKWFDLNHDGETNILDMEHERDAFLRLGQVPADKKSQVGNNFEIWWRKYLFWGQSGIEKEQFVNYMNTAFVKDKALFTDRMRQCFGTIFDIAETGKDALSEDEFLVVFKAAGHGNEPLNRQFFQAYNPVNGKVPIKTLVDSWLVFTTCDDSSVPDIVMQAYKAGF